MKKISRTLKALFACLLSVLLLCAPISSSDSTGAIENPETFNFNSKPPEKFKHNPSNFNDDSAILIQKIQNNPSLLISLDDLEDDYLADFINDPSLPHANLNTSIQANSTSDIVAQLQIFAWEGDGSSSSSSFSTKGHAFLVITNLSDHNICAGSLYIKPNTGITIGTWDYFADEHRGLWYCLEGYHYYHYHDYSNSYSLSVNLTQSLLDRVNTIIRKSDSWDPLNNCSTFASNVWNSVCSDKVNAGFPNTPKALKESIASYGLKYYGIGVEIPVYYAAYYGEPPTKSKNVI